MNTQKTAALVAVYGAVSLLLGAIYLIGVNSLGLDVTSICCILTGLVTIGVSFFMLRRVGWSFWLGLILTGLMMLLMAWQSIAKLHHFIDMIQNDKVNSPYSAGEGFLIVFTIFLLSLFVGAIQIMLARSNARELNN